MSLDDILNLIKEEKYQNISSQNFEMAAALRDIERNFINEKQSFISKDFEIETFISYRFFKFIRNHYYYENIKKCSFFNILVQLERKLKLEKLQ